MADQDFNIKVVTTADTRGIRETSIGLAELQKQQQAQAAAAQQMGYELGRSLRIIAGGAAIAGGYKFVSELRESAARIEKISQELDKQGAQLVQNVQHLAQESRFAITEADGIKLATSEAKNLLEAKKRMTEAAQEELTATQKIVDIWTVGYRLRNQGPNAEALRQKQQQTAQDYFAERQATLDAIAASKRNELTRASETYEETVNRLNQRIKEQQNLANIHWQQQDIESYLAAATAVQKYKQELEQFLAVQKKIRESPTSSALEKERATPLGAANRLQSQLSQLSDLGDRRDLTPAEEKAARDAYVNTQNALRDTQIKDERDARDAQAKAIRDRYSGTNLPNQKPGESQAGFNQEILTALHEIRDLFR